MQRSGAAESVDDKFARIVAAFDRHLPDQVRHVVIGDLNYAAGGISHAHV